MPLSALVTQRAKPSLKNQADIGGLHVHRLVRLREAAKSSGSGVPAKVVHLSLDCYEGMIKIICVKPLSWLSFPVPQTIRLLEDTPNMKHLENAE